MDGTQLPEAIERVRSQFAQWRMHKSGRDRIPDRLWHLAVEAARRHGVHAVSRAVRLEHAALRRRLADGAGRAAEALAFVEMDDVTMANGGGCIIELEKGNGTRMRICVRDGAAVDWARMKEAFLGA